MMRKVIAAALAAALVASPAVALAQEGTPRPQQASAGRTDQSAPSPADLGISLERVRRELRELPPVTSTLLRYDFHVDVYGENPKVDFFKDFDLSAGGAVRYGGMTHAEFLEVATPQAYRAPSADLIGLAVWAATQLAKKKLKDNSSDKQDR
jgi:hypothetical protein